MLGLCLLVGLARASPVRPRAEESGHQPEAALRIVGGSQSMPNEYPFLVSIMYKAEPPFKDWMLDYHMCGGSLVGVKTVLTAAHCMIFPEPENYAIYWHGHNLTNVDPATHLPYPWTCDEVIEVESFTCHEEFRTNPADGNLNDVCLLFLKKTPRCLGAPDAYGNAAIPYEEVRSPPSDPPIPPLTPRIPLDPSDAPVTAILLSHRHPPSDTPSSPRRRSSSSTSRHL